MIVPHHNPLTMNRIGLLPVEVDGEREWPSRMFPVGFRVEQLDHAAIVNVQPLSLLYVADLVAEVSHPRVMIYGVGMNEFLVDDDGNGLGAIPMATVLEEAGVRAIERFGEDVVLATSDLVPFLDRLHAYDTCVYDIGESLQDLSESYVTAAEHQHRDGPLLPKLPDSELYAANHDECYLHLEARAGMEFPLGVLGRSLTLVVGTALNEEGRPPVDITEPDLEIASDVLGGSGSFIADQELVTLEKGRVTVPFANAPWTSYGQVAAPSRSLIYDPQQDSWRLD